MARKSKAIESVSDKTDELNEKKPKKVKTEKSLESERENKKVFANFVVLIISISVLAAVFAVFTPTSKSESITPKVTYTWKIMLNIINDEFGASNNFKNCSGTKSFPGITGSTINVTNSAGNQTLSFKIANASEALTNSCNYIILSNAKVENMSGKVKVWAVFPFGDSEKFEVDLGKTPPYSIKLNLSFN